MPVLLTQHKLGSPHTTMTPVAPFLYSLPQIHSLVSIVRVCLINLNSCFSGW